jgi:glycogen debranching enzyme
VTLVDGVTFCICGRTGDIREGAEQGLFHRDTRFLSRWELEVNRQRLDPLSAISPNGYEATFIARRPPRSGEADSTLLVVRHRLVADGMVEQITVRNLGQEPAAVGLALTFAADFGGLFEVKEGRVWQRKKIDVVDDPRGIALSCDFGTDSRGVVIEVSEGHTISADVLSWQLVVPPRDEKTVWAQVIPVLGGAEVQPRHRPGEPVHTSRPATRLAQWRREAPRLRAADPRLPALLSTSVEDLGVLRIFDDQEHPARAVVAAGAPWFMALFGRDSLLTSWMLLPFDQSVALGTLRTLADLQGQRVDERTEEQPGRILHEARSMPQDGVELGEASVYYGSVDATPLFVMVLDECRRWGAPLAEIESLLPHANAAIDWIGEYGYRDRDGFVEYCRATDRGLVNQGWKDSFDAINFASGALAGPPIALAEVQGYVYAAYLARARLAIAFGDRDAAAHWAQMAGELKRRFNEQFWLADEGFYAVALDREKRPVDSVTSNIGHCMWTGIVDEDRAAAVAERLLSPEMFTGFGVRTLSSRMGAYNPMSYHNGSVWPHDNAIVAAGLTRYGFAADAQRVVRGMIDAAHQMGGRLPELFCGFDRGEFGGAPVPYPTSCAPQAWASASVLLMLRTLLRFEPDVSRGVLAVDPAVPADWLPLEVDQLHVAGAPVSVQVTSEGCDVAGLPDGVVLEQVTAARRPRRPQSLSARDLLSEL